ncbi:MAG: NgoFVII family restriction endonuclease [Candidatus Methanofastidiosum sp.]|nr:NgoFVII family restriction endonuclease [Methanofastidiosum sp.]
MKKGVLDSKLMINDQLFEKVLIEPIKNGADKLLIVSGFASPAMVLHHFEEVKRIDKKIEVHLIAGMYIKEGLPKSTHIGFTKLLTEDYSPFFKCSYIFQNKPVHSKVYVWLKECNPFKCYIGSANYTQNAFFLNNREVLTENKPVEGFDYFNSLIDDSIYCNHIDIEKYFVIFDEKKYPNLSKRRTDIIQNEESGLPSLKISLLTSREEIGIHSGLNWGQREGRNQNQAYIPLKKDVYQTDFFPPRKIHFTVRTDDDKILICSRAQDSGKAIHTPHNNSLLGEYFRYRLNLANGQFVEKEDLVRYGRTDVDFYKIDDENYYMDFSV